MFEFPKSKLLVNPKMMCEPASIAIAGLAITAASTGLSVYSSYQQQQSQNAANEYNARLMERNAQQSQLEAQDAIDRGKVAENDQRLQVKKMIGAQRAAAASGGLLADSGSNLDLTGDTAGYGELDALTIRRNAQLEAWGIRNNAENYTGQANLSRMKSSSPLLAAGGSLLTGASQFAGQLYNYKTSTSGKGNYKV